MFSFIYIFILYSSIFFKVFKVLYSVLVHRSKSPIKYANLCTEEKEQKKRKNLQYIHQFMYIFIYIYRDIYIQTSALSRVAFEPLFTCKLPAFMNL